MVGHSARIVPLVLAASLFAGQALAQEAEISRYILVQGEGEVSAVPDTAMVSAGVETRAQTARDAMTRNSEAMEKLFAALKAAGIPERSIRTLRLSVSPEYDRSSSRQEQREPVAYRAANQVDVTVGDIGRVGALIDALVSAGANQIRGVRFLIDKPEALENEARRKAVADARRKAELFATAAGVAVGAVQRIEEHGTSSPAPRMVSAMALARDVPVAPGEQTVRAVVSVRFAIAE